MATSVEYLGHKIGAKGRYTLEHKVEAIQKAPNPKNTQQLKSFLSLVSYYGKFVPYLSSLLHPLNQLLILLHVLAQLVNGVYIVHPWITLPPTFK